MLELGIWKTVGRKSSRCSVGLFVVCFGRGTKSSPFKAEIVCQPEGDQGLIGREIVEPSGIRDVLPDLMSIH